MELTRERTMLCPNRSSRPGWPLRAASFCGLGAMLALAAAPAGAQEGSPWGIAAQHVTVDLSAADGSAEVTVAWLLASSEPGAALPSGESVPLSLLGFGEADVPDVVRDGRGTIVLWPASGSRRTAMVHPPFDARDDSLVMRFTYRVAAAVEVEGPRARARVPMLTGPAVLGARAGGRDGAVLGGVGPAGFSAEVRIPEQWVVADAFPSDIRRGEDGSYTVFLPTAPAMIGFRARTDGRWLPGVPVLIDILTVTLLLAFAAFGWRHLRGVVSGKRNAGTPVEGGFS